MADSREILEFWFGDLDADGFTVEDKSEMWWGKNPGLDALINRATFYRLVDLAEPSPNDPKVLGVRSCGQFFPLGKI